MPPKKKTSDHIQTPSPNTPRRSPRFATNRRSRRLANLTPIDYTPSPKKQKTTPKKSPKPVAESRAEAGGSSSGKLVAEAGGSSSGKPVDEAGGSSSGKRVAEAGGSSSDEPMDEAGSSSSDEPMAEAGGSFSDKALAITVAKAMASSDKELIKTVTKVMDEEIAKATGGAGGSSSKRKPIVIIEHCTESGSLFKLKADEVKKALEDDVPSVAVEVNPIKPRKGSFTVRMTGGVTFVSYLEMKKPYSDMVHIDAAKITRQVRERL